MHCPYCGKPVPVTATTCPSCYEDLQEGVPEIPNYFVGALLSTLFCCLPIGIASIVYSTQVNKKLQAGDIAGAQQASKNAKSAMIASIVLWLVFFLVYVGFIAISQR